MEQRLVAEYRRLNDLQEAIKLESVELEELHQIKKNVNTLNAILLAQKEYKARFEQEMQQEENDFALEVGTKRVQWAKEQEGMESERKERELRIKKERAREEEEYRYTTMLERKKEQDSYEARQAMQEKELEERRSRVLQELKQREEIIVASEAEFNVMKERIERFPKELEKAIKDTETNTRENIERTYQYEMDLAAKELNGERKLNSQIITSLQDKIKEQENFIRQLTQKTDEAGTQVQAIALKALEGASFRYCPSIEDGKKNQFSSI